MVTRKARGRPRKYDWTEWFSRQSFRLTAGVDYSVPQASMAGMIRSAASRLGKRIRVVDTGNGFDVTVRTPAKNPTLV